MTETEDATLLARPIDPGVRIGHVHLKVADIERVARLLLRRARLPADPARYGKQAAFFAAGGYHHHFGINTWESKGGRRRLPARPGSTTRPSSTRPAPRSPTRSAG